LLTNTLPANSLGYTDTTALSGVNYVYRVKALSTVAGVTTAGAASLSAQVAGALLVTPPTALTAASPTGVGVTLSWVDSSNNETSFQVERAIATPGSVPVFAAIGTPVTRTAALGTATGGAVTFTDATAVAGPSYIYQVRAVKTVVATATVAASVSMSLPSNQANITLAITAPITPTAVQAGANVTVGWVDKSANETAFEVLRTDTTGLTLPVTFTVARTAALGTAVNGAVTYSDTTAVVGTPYTYQVRAVYTPVVVAPAVAVPSYSAYTTAVNATVVLQAPTTLTTALPAAPATTGVILNWVDNATFETAYRIDRAIVTLDATGNIPAGTVYAPLATVATTALRRATATTATGPTAYTDTTAAPATLGAGQAYAYQVVSIYTKPVVAPAVAVPAYSLPSNAAHTAGAVAVTGAPTALTAVTTSGTSIVLSWIDNTAVETAYTVTRTDNTNPLLPVVVTTNLSVVKGTGAKGTYTDLTAVVGTLYTYTVTPVVPVVAGAPVVNLSASITAGLALNAPTNATVALVATGIQIGWTDTSNNETGFQIARVVIDPVTGLPTAAAPVLLPVTSTAAQKTAVGSVRTFIDTTALPGVIYSYTVASVSGLNISAAIPTAPITITAPIAAPSTPSAVVTNASRITVTWTDLSTNETGFVVERLLTPAVPVAGAPAPVWTTLATVARSATLKTAINGAVSYVDNLVAPVVQGSYQYRVTAVNQTGVAPAAVVTNGSSAAVMSNIVSLAVPAAPTALTAAVTATVTGVVNLTWADNSTNETGFTVQRATNATFTAGLVSTSVPGANATTTVNYALNGLTKGTILYFRVQATNASGVSTWASTVTPVTVP
jgi:titin